MYMKNSCLFVGRNFASVRTLLCLTAAIACMGSSIVAADSIVPDLKKLAGEIESKTAGDATVRWETNVKGKDALFSRRVIWLDSVNFTEGTIECDILGKSTPRGSNFPGIAFHGVDDSTFDCVYFRPFNFRAENPENASHAVQYISLPQWPWQKLRAEKTDQYEKPIAPPPDGDAWFHTKIVVVGGKVRVFVNGAEKASLEVEKLNDRTSRRIAIWGGDAGNGAHFANLKITPWRN
jgi:hypothetical protein